MVITYFTKSLFSVLICICSLSEMCFFLLLMPKVVINVQNIFLFFRVIVHRFFFAYWECCIKACASAEFRLPLISLWELIIEQTIEL